MQAQLYNTRNATKPSKTYRKKKTKQKKKQLQANSIFSKTFISRHIFWNYFLWIFPREAKLFLWNSFNCKAKQWFLWHLHMRSWFFFLRCFQYKVKYTHCMLDKWNLLPFLGFGYSILHAHETCCDQNKQWAVLKKLWLTSQTHCHSPFKDFKSDSGALNLLFQLIHKLNWQRIDRDRYGDRCTSVVLSCVQHYDT